MITEAEAREQEREQITELLRLMQENPDLPLKIIGRSDFADGGLCQGGWYSATARGPEIRDVAWGRKSHMVVRDDDGNYDSPPDIYDGPEEELKWYRAIVIWVY